MFRIIKNAIFVIKYDAGDTQIVECNDMLELYEFLAEQQVLNNNTFYSVHKVQKDGSLLKVEVKTNNDFIRLVNEYKSQYELVLREEIHINDNKVWQLSLIPQKREDCNLLYEFYTGWSKNLTALRNAALNWAKNHETPGLRITIIEAE